MKTKNLDIYGSPPLPWSRARDLLDAMRNETGHGSSWFLSTVRPDGRPHAAGVNDVGLTVDHTRTWVCGTFDGAGMGIAELTLIIH